MSDFHEVERPRSRRGTTSEAHERNTAILATGRTGKALFFAANGVPQWTLANRLRNAVQKAAAAAECRIKTRTSDSPAGVVIWAEPKDTGGGQ